MIFGGSYTDNSPLEWQSVAAWLLYGAGAIICWAACAFIGAAIDWATGQMVFTLFGAFGVPILGVLVNGWRAG